MVYLCHQMFAQPQSKILITSLLPLNHVYAVHFFNDRCNNKYLELDRNSVKTGDYQRVKLTELDEIAQPEISTGDNEAAAAMASAARVPRTLEVEVRDTLVNTCVPGDLLCIVGVVKTVQVNVFCCLSTHMCMHWLMI